jgi:hypothetical protein
MAWQGKMISSRAGYHAYAEVEAIAFKPKYQGTYTGSLCENRVRLLLAKADGSSFQILLDSNSPKGDCVTVEGAESCEVKGIQLVDWSRDGTFLLADLVQWVYESDALLMHVPIIYDVPNGKFIRPDVYHFFDEFYYHTRQEISVNSYSALKDFRLTAISSFQLHDHRMTPPLMSKYFVWTKSRRFYST